jgi:hypothetical protein
MPAPGSAARAARRDQSTIDPLAPGTWVNGSRSSVAGVPASFGRSDFGSTCTFSNLGLSTRFTARLSSAYCSGPRYIHVAAEIQPLSKENRRAVSRSQPSAVITRSIADRYPTLGQRHEKSLML